ncbi:MAG: hypothetical protein ISP49_03045 [Reyranella sp.]|nr:hypothetical protein [Reyranella sp.]
MHQHDEEDHHHHDDDGRARPMSTPLEQLPRRIFLDSCTAQTLRDYGAFIFEGEAIPDSDRLFRVPGGVEKVEALRDIFQLNERAQFEWIVSHASMVEANDKGDPGHLRWVYDIARHSAACLALDGASKESWAHAARLREPRFGYLGKKDHVLLEEAVAFRCEVFLTMERRLPRNAEPIERELGIRILTPVTYWQMLRPWAALWQ